MKTFKDMASSSSNWYIFIMVLGLTAMTGYALVFYPNSVFKDVLALFGLTLGGLTSYKYTKSRPQETLKPEPSQDIVLEK